MPSKLTPELKAALAELLADDDDTDTVKEDEEPEEDPDEFTYRGKRYVYTPDDVKAARKQVKKAAEPEGEPVEETPQPRRKRFVT